jgi:hypothetical protein
MKKLKIRFLKWLYRGNEEVFAALMVENFFYEIPHNISAPATDFFSSHRETLEKFFTIQAYLIQKRSIGDVKNTQHYAGVLFYIKFLLALVRKGTIKKEEVRVNEVKNDPIQDVEYFMNNYGKTN